MCHHHHIAVMQLGHLLTHSGLTHSEVSSKLCHNSFCQLGNSVSLPWVIYYEAFYMLCECAHVCVYILPKKQLSYILIIARNMVHDLKIKSAYEQYHKLRVGHWSNNSSIQKPVSYKMTTITSR
jgi:hypothetical protein